MGRKSRNKRLRALQPKPIVISRKKKISNFFRRLLLPFKACLLLFKESSMFIKVSLIVSIIFFCATIIVNSNKTKILNGKIVLDGPISISYSSNQIPDSTEDRISPICGCLFKHPHHGVMFFGNHYEIEVQKNNTENNYLNFQITSPYHSMDIEPYFLFDCTILKINKDDSYKLLGLFNKHPDSLDSFLDSSALQKTLPIQYYSQHKQIYYFSFLDTSRKIDFYHLGRFPISALIPMKNSEIDIIKYRDTYEHIYNEVTLSEKFDSKDNSQFMNMPMLDVLGAYNLIIGDCEYVRTNDAVTETVSDKKSVYCFILKSGLSNRISFNELTSQNIQHLYEQPTTAIYSQQSGEFTIHIPSAMSDEEYIKMKKKMYSYYRDSLPQATVMSGKYAVTLLAPPSLEEYNGIDFYGHNLKLIQCLETYGNIQFGKKDWSLEPFRNVSMKNLKDFEFYDEPVILPLNYDSKSNLATKFRGEGELYIDDDFAGESFWDEDFVVRVSFLLGVISSIIGLIPLIKNFHFHFSEKYKTLANKN